MNLIHFTSSLGRNENEFSFRILASRDKNFFGTPLHVPFGLGKALASSDVRAVNLPSGAMVGQV